MRSSPTAKEGERNHSEDSLPSGTAKYKFFMIFAVKIALITVAFAILIAYVGGYLLPRFALGGDYTIAPAKVIFFDHGANRQAIASATGDVDDDKVVAELAKWRIHTEVLGRDEGSAAWKAKLLLETQGETVDAVEFVYGAPVNMQKEGVLETIVRLVDIFRSPEAAKDQLGLNLYDVDQLYESLAKTNAAQLQTELSELFISLDMKESREGDCEFVTFVMRAPGETEPTGASWWGSSPVKYLSTPVLWDQDLTNLFFHSSGLKTPVTEFSYGLFPDTQIVKGAMAAVVASANGLAVEPVVAQYGSSDTMLQTKMYLGVSTHIEGVDVKPISAIGLKSKLEPAHKLCNMMTR